MQPFWGPNAKYVAKMFIIGLALSYLLFGPLFPIFEAFGDWISSLVGVEPTSR